MLSAIAKSTKEVVAAKGANGKEEFSCPDCKQTVYPRHRAKWTDHFVHKPNSVCKTKLVASLESDEHKLGKQLIVDWLKKTITAPSVEIVTEKTITTVDGGCREIDVAVVKDGKVVEAHECQLSPICVHTDGNGLLDRTMDYCRLGIPVTWWMGNEANSLTVIEFFENFQPGISKNARESKINEPFHLWTYHVTPSSTIEKETKLGLKNKKYQDTTLAQNNKTSLIVSRVIGGFLNGVRSQMTTEEQLEQDRITLQLYKDYGDFDFENLVGTKQEILSMVVLSYTETAFKYHELDEACIERSANKKAFELAQLIREDVTELASNCIPDEVFQFASPCFDVFNFLKTVASTPLNSSAKDTNRDALDSFFKYANPLTAQTFVKEAITNALDQNPSDATALCSAWEKIQPTLEKPIKPTPVLASEVAKENLSFLANGNGRN